MAFTPVASLTPLTGADFRGEVSRLTRRSEGTVVGLLAYSILEREGGVDEYDRWLYSEHYPDLLANPHLQKICLRSVCPGKKARLSSGASVVNELEFDRLAELHFASHDAYAQYIEWFQANVVPKARTPAGRSAFKFYLLSEGEWVARAS